jgi:hypothetical protein
MTPNYAVNDTAKRIRRNFNQSVTSCSNLRPLYNIAHSWSPKQPKKGCLFDVECRIFLVFDRVIQPNVPSGESPRGNW